jgi:Gas vesicle synthesis protein GvpL/GvpF
MLLLYCMTQDEIALPCSGIAGVSGADLCEVAKNGVRYFYSEWDPANSADGVKQQALEFHRVNQEILEHITLIPFRFPTSVAGEAELAGLMEAQSSEYSQELERLRGAVQMKITIEGPESPNTLAPASSGTEYLKQKQRVTAPVNAIVEQIRRTTAGLAHETKQSHRQNGVVLFVLVQREHIEGVRIALSKLDVEASKVSVSGPWPPSEFVNCYPESSRANQKC